MRGKLIALEGIDNVGKTTLSKLLLKELRRLGIAAVRYENIENKRKGFNLLKPFVKKFAPIDASFLFYLASAVYKSQRIERLLKKQWVICDRYAYSTVAHHLACGASKKIASLFPGLKIHKPEYLFLIVADEPLRIARANWRKDGTRDDLKTKAEHREISRKERILKRFHPITIDNSSTPAAALERILAHI